MEIKTAKICWNICAKCKRSIILDIQHEGPFPNLYLVNLNKRYIRKINLYCYKANFNCMDNFKYLIQNWQFSYGEYKEANKIYHAFEKYTKKNQYGMNELDFNKFKPKSKKIKKLSEDIYVSEDFCPYYIEHQLSEWNENES